MKKIRLVTLIFVLIVGVVFFAACEKEVSFDPQNPVLLKFTAYYNDLQLKIFNNMVDEFNSTRGKELGIIIEPISIPSVNGINKYLIESANNEAGSDTFPDIFITYKSVIPYFNGNKELVNFKEYFSDEEVSEYLEKFVDEGYFSKDKSVLNMLPIASSTEIMYVNKTDFNEFAEKSNVNIEDLSNFENIIEIAEKYYDYTDAQTPDIQNDGKSLIGLDTKAENAFSIMQSMDESLVVEKNGKYELNFKEETARKLWNLYIVPSFKGYMAKHSKFTSEDLQSGKLLIAIASTAGSSYVSDYVYDEELKDQKEVEILTLPSPKLEGFEPVFAQQGGGIFVSKTDKIKEKAAIEFIKWLTNKENNIEFALKCSYIPVRKDNTNEDYIEEKAKEFQIPSKTKDSIITSITQISNSSIYVRPTFDNYEQLRTKLIEILEYNIKDKRADILLEAAENNNYEELIEKSTDEESFKKWYKRSFEVLSSVFTE